MRLNQTPTEIIIPGRTSTSQATFGPFFLPEEPQPYTEELGPAPRIPVRPGAFLPFLPSIIGKEPPEIFGNPVTVPPLVREELMNGMFGDIGIPVKQFKHMRFRSPNQVTISIVALPEQAKELVFRFRKDRIPKTFVSVIPERIGGGFVIRTYRQFVPRITPILEEMNIEFTEFEEQLAGNPFRGVPGIGQDEGPVQRVIVVRDESPPNLLNILITVGLFVFATRVLFPLKTNAVLPKQLLR